MNSESNILLVEDNQSDMQLALHVIAKEASSCRVHVMRDGEEALSALFGREGRLLAGPTSFSLVLLDLKLPKVNGLEVLKRIKTDPLAKAVPVVMLSSSNQTRDVDASYELGANAYVQKPVEFEEFRKVLRSIAEFWLGVNLTSHRVAIDP